MRRALLVLVTVFGGALQAQPAFAEECISSDIMDKDSYAIDWKFSGSIINDADTTSSGSVYTLLLPDGCVDTWTNRIMLVFGKRLSESDRKRAMLCKAGTSANVSGNGVSALGTGMVEFIVTDFQCN